MSLIVATGCGAKPDLVVTNFATTGAPTVNADNSAQVQVTVTIKNQGTVSATAFKMATEYRDGATTYVVAFTDSSPTGSHGSDLWYPWVDSLAAGAEVTKTGTLTWHSAVHGLTVPLWVTADSCSGDELTEIFCRVDESDEANNASSEVSVTLP
jgi:hypothetical protein